MSNINLHDETYLFVHSWGIFHDTSELLRTLGALHYLDFDKVADFGNDCRREEPDYYKGKIVTVKELAQSWGCPLTTLIDFLDKNYKKSWIAEPTWDIISEPYDDKCGNRLRLFSQTLNFLKFRECTIQVVVQFPHRIARGKNKGMIKPKIRVQDLGYYVTRKEWNK